MAGEIGSVYSDVRAAEANVYNSQSTGSTISAGFLKTLQQTMVGWLETINDSKITQNELNYVGSLANDSVSAFNIDDLNNDTSDVVYEGAAAMLFMSTTISDLNNIISWIFSFISMQNDIFDQASSMMSK